MTIPSSFLNTLTSYLSGLEEDGIRRIETTEGFPSAPRPESPAKEKPRQVVTQNKVLPREEKSTLLPKKPVETVTPSIPALPSLRVFTLTLHPDCGDPESGPHIALVTDQDELTEENQSLLRDMIHAIGFVLPEQSTAFEEFDNLTQVGKRILVMGNTALKQVSTAGMDLQIVRGMWQQSIHGKLISTFPPSYLHDNPPGKKAAWGDLQKLLADLGLSLPQWTQKRLKKS